MLLVKHNHRFKDILTNICFQNLIKETKSLDTDYSLSSKKNAVREASFDHSCLMSCTFYHVVLFVNVIRDFLLSDIVTPSSCCVQLLDGYAMYTQLFYANFSYNVVMHMALNNSSYCSFVDVFNACHDAAERRH